MHQVNIEYLAPTVMVRNGQAYPDTCVGTDSHTTMVNGLGVLIRPRSLPPAARFWR